MAVLNQELLDTLADPARAPRATALMAFSDADQGAVKLLRTSWDKIPVERRRLIVHRLVDIAEDNVEADFHQALRVFLKDADPEVRATAVQGLWEDGSPALLRELMALLKDDASATVRRAVAEGLGFFAMEGAVGGLPPERMAALRDALLASYLRDGEEPEVKGAALVSAAVFGDEEIRENIALAYGSADPVLRAKALAAMGNHLAACWEPVVMREMKSADAAMRYEAATAAGYMELAAAVPVLIELSRDPDAEVRLAAIAAVGQVGGQTARRHLQALLKSADPAVQEAASTALDEMAFNDNPLATLPLDLPSDSSKKAKTH